MKSALLSGAVWRRIKKLSESSASTIAAVPYFGVGATELLKLQPGHILVLKFDLDTIGSGQVDPKEVVKAIRRNVEVHHCLNLHAKLFVFDKTAVVGSSNVSRNSERHLLEACIETTDEKVVRSAKRFIRSLLGDRIGLEYAEQMIPFYRPPIRSVIGTSRASTSKRTPAHSDMWLVSLVTEPWQDVDYVQEERGWSAAEKAIKNPRAFEVEDFQWSGERMLSRFRVGQRVLQCTRTDGGKIFLSPPSRIVSIRRYSVKGRKRAIVFLEKPRKYRRRQLGAVLKRLGPKAQRLGNPRRTKQLRDSELVYELARLWS